MFCHLCVVFQAQRDLLKQIKETETLQTKFNQKQIWVEVEPGYEPPLPDVRGTINDAASVSINDAQEPEPAETSGRFQPPSNTEDVQDLYSEEDFGLASQPVESAGLQATQQQSAVNDPYDDLYSDGNFENSCSASNFIQLHCCPHIWHFGPSYTRWARHRWPASRFFKCQTGTHRVWIKFSPLSCQIIQNAKYFRSIGCCFCRRAGNHLLCVHTFVLRRHHRSWRYVECLCLWLVEFYSWFGVQFKLKIHVVNFFWNVTGTKRKFFPRVTRFACCCPQIVVIPKKSPKLEKLKKLLCLNGILVQCKFPRHVLSCGIRQRQAPWEKDVPRAPGISYAHAGKSQSTVSLKSSTKKLKI